MSFRLVGNEKERLVQWASPRFPDTPYQPYWGEHYWALGLEKDGDIQAVVIYNELYPSNSVSCHIAALDGGRWLTRPFLAAMFHYPFVQLGLRRLNLKIGANNRKAIRFATHLGFRLEGVHPDGWEAGIPLLSFGMLKNECRFLSERFQKTINGQAERTPSPRPSTNDSCTVGG